MFIRARLLTRGKHFLEFRSLGTCDNAKENSRLILVSSRPNKQREQGSSWAINKEVFNVEIRYCWDPFVNNMLLVSQ